MTGNNNSKTGVWLIGALGDVATTLIVGSLAIGRKLTAPTGMVSCLAPMNQLNLTSVDKLIFGGQDIRSITATEAAKEISQRSRTFTSELLDQIQPELSKIDGNIVNSSHLNWSSNATEQQKDLTEIVRAQRLLLSTFIEQNKLDHLVVINLASAEPTAAEACEFESLKNFEQLISNNRKDLVLPSMLHAYAAFQQGCSYINFTPNSGASIPALQELAKQNNLPHYGNDGKTGETLVKTALAPMFLKRNLHIMSWEGINMLGNNDGKNLNKPDRCEGKLKNKADVLQNILSYPLHNDVNINYVPSLGDWKTAWDMIHFKGFLDVPMTMQFTWQGCDSILAAPLILDMIRFSEFAVRHNESGPMHHLSSFFKNPIEVDEMAFFPQFEMLLNYTYKHLSLQQTSAPDSNRTEPKNIAGG